VNRVLAIVLIALGIAGPAIAGRSAAGSKGPAVAGQSSTLVVGTRAEPKSLNPIAISAKPSAFLERRVSEFFPAINVSSLEKISGRHRTTIRALFLAAEVLKSDQTSSIFELDRLRAPQENAVWRNTISTAPSPVPPRFLRTAGPR